MWRRAMADLVAWKDSPNRKPLIVNGARQVGKTWLVKEFAREYFDNLAYVVFLDNEQAHRIFEGSLNPKNLLTLIGAVTNTSPHDGRTLIFLDEIQECPRAITALKLFQEQMPNIPIIAAGSLLGVALNKEGKRKGLEDDQEKEDKKKSQKKEKYKVQRVSWPVGKVNYLDLYPLTFGEFVHAVGSPQLANLLNVGNPNMLDVLQEQLTTLLKEYLYVGGMPEVVQTYAETRDLSAARKIQTELLRGYELDFSKHVANPLMTERIRETWRSVPSQLANESEIKRFTYASIKTGARGRDYRDAVSWLADAGLVTQVTRISKAGVPLEGYADRTYFKLYLLDVGLLGAATHLEPSIILDSSRQFTEYKGAYAEQYVCQQLRAYRGAVPYYWSADGKKQKAEVDFVIEHGGEVLPIEVKADENVKGGSLSLFCRSYGIEKALRFSLLGYKEQSWLVNIPLYGIETLFR